MSQRILSELMTLVMVFVMLALTVETSPVPSEYGEDNNPYYSELEKVPANILIELMARFRQTMIRARNDLENSKRAVDFGLARGYSGTQEAKHRMGLAAANFPGGPGRRRRSDNET